MLTIFTTENYEEYPLKKVIGVLDMDKDQTNSYVSNLMAEKSNLIEIRGQQMRYNGNIYVDKKDVYVLCFKDKKSGEESTMLPPCPKFGVDEKEVINYFID